MSYADREKSVFYETPLETVKVLTALQARTDVWSLGGLAPTGKLSHHEQRALEQYLRDRFNLWWCSRVQPRLTDLEIRLTPRPVKPRKKKA